MIFFSWPQISSLQHQKLDFEEFAAAAINVYQLEGMDCWEQRARHAYEFFDKDGNKPIMIQELVSVWFIMQHSFCSVLGITHEN